ncbi:MAG: amidohydrolase family protein [Gemmatimonadetes bacterium]|nr:amidohydrolase family protein [Gemmatimonadota bacterium]
MKTTTFVPTTTAGLLLILLTGTPGGAQDLTFEEYEPRSTLVVPEHPVTRARIPFIDVHSHHRRLTPERVDSVVAAMDRLNMAALVNLSGGSGAALAERVRQTAGRHPGRFVTFANLDFTGIDEPGWGERAARQLEEDVRLHGAAGLKIFKNLGLDLKDGAGRRVPTNDPRLDPVWARAGELGVPVLIHTGEPAEFFEPHDRFNERWLELKQFPRRARPPEAYPSWEEVMAEQHDVFRKHRGTTFINAHLGWMGNDLDRLGRLLDEHPNVVTEVAAVIAELGRQPRHARAFLVRYQDRVLFGKDTFAEEEYHTYLRLFETADEYFPYFRRRHAFWRLYGLDLPDPVLRKLYSENARRVIPALRPGAP